MSYDVVVLSILVALFSLVVPASAFAQTWDETSRSMQQSEESTGEWEVRIAAAEDAPNIPLMVLAQSGGILASYLALILPAAVLANAGLESGNDALLTLSLVPLIAIPFVWPLVTNKIGKVMHGGDHLGWSFAGAALGFAGMVGFRLLFNHFNFQRYTSDATALSRPAAITFGILSVSSPFIGTIGGYHFGRSRAEDASDASLSLSPLIDRDHGVGASLNLSLSF